MKLIYTRNWFATVKRANFDGPVEVNVHFADSASEMRGWMKVNPSDLKVIEAHCETYRSQNSRSELGRLALPGLVGIEMYFGCGKAIAQNIPDDPGGRIADLFKEGVKVLIQAEPMILEDRGCASLYEYQEKLWTKIANTCYYLAHPNHSRSTVKDKLQFHHRGENLFSRHRTIGVYVDGDHFRVLGLISDGWHELDVDISVRRDDYEVTAAQGNFVRLPDEVCMGSAEMVSSMVGQTFTTENIRKLARSVGNSCEHLMDLTREALKAIHCDWVQHEDRTRWPIRGMGGHIDLQR